VFTASNPSNGIDDKAQDRPEKARYHREWATKSLDGKSGRISIGDIVRAGEATFSKRYLCATEEPYITEKARRKRTNFPPPFQGDKTWPSNPPVPPFAKAST